MRYIILLWCFVTIYSCSEKPQQAVIPFESQEDEGFLKQCNCELKEGETKVFYHPANYFYHQEEYLPQLSLEKGKIGFFHQSKWYELNLTSGKYYPITKICGESIDDLFQIKCQAMSKDLYENCIWRVSLSDKLIRTTTSGYKSDTFGFVSSCREIIPKKEKLLLICYNAVLKFDKKTQKHDTLFPSSDLQKRNILNGIYSHPVILQKYLLINDSTVLNLDNLITHKLLKTNNFKDRFENYEGYRKDSLAIFHDGQFIFLKQPLNNIKKIKSTSSYIYTYENTSIYTYNTITGQYDSCQTIPFYLVKEFGKDTLIGVSGSRDVSLFPAQYGSSTIMYCVKEQKILYYPKRQHIVNLLVDDCNIYWFNLNSLRMESRATFLKQLKPYPSDTFYATRKLFEKEYNAIPIKSKNEKKIFSKFHKLYRKYHGSLDITLSSKVFQLHKILEEKFLTNDIHYLKNVVFSTSYTTEYKISAWWKLKNIFAERQQFDSILIYHSLYLKRNNNTEEEPSFYKDDTDVSAIKKYMNTSRFSEENPLNDSLYYRKINCLEELHFDFYNGLESVISKFYFQEINHFIKTFPKRKYLDNVILKKILGQFQIDSSENKWEKATAKVVAFKRKYPNSDCMDEADYWLFYNNATDNKGNYYCSGDDFLKKHPKSKYAKKVKKELEN